jgi:hypothetical protein
MPMMMNQAHAKGPIQVRTSLMATSYAGILVCVCRSKRLLSERHATAPRDVRPGERGRRNFEQGAVAWKSRTEAE